MVEALCPWLESYWFSWCTMNPRPSECRDNVATFVLCVVNRRSNKCRDNGASYHCCGSLLVTHNLTLVNISPWLTLSYICLGYTKEWERHPSFSTTEGVPPKYHNVTKPLTSEYHPVLNACSLIGTGTVELSKCTMIKQDSNIMAELLFSTGHNK